MPKALVTLLFFAGIFGNCYSDQHDTAKCGKNSTVFTYSNYVVYEQFNPEKGTNDILVLERNKENNCTRNISKAIFVLKEQENGFFINLFQNFIFIDYGTGPDARTLSVYNFKTGKKVLDTPYSDTLIKIGKDSVSIWIESSDTNFTKCAEYQKWKENGLEAGIVVEHYFDLKSLKLYKTQNSKCVAKQ